MGLTEEDSFKKVKADSGEIDSDDYTNPKGKPKRTKIETTDLVCNRLHIEVIQLITEVSI